MEKQNYILIGILAIAVMGLVFTAFNVFSSKQPVQASQISSGGATKSQYQTKTSEGEVTVSITPNGLKNGNLVFEIEFNTHTVDLSQFDLKKLVVLEADGRQIAPISTPALSGHHNSGELVFDIKNEPKKFKLKIKEIPDVNDRMLEWP